MTAMKCRKGYDGHVRRECYDDHTGKNVAARFRPESISDLRGGPPRPGYITDGGMQRHPDSKNGREPR